MNPPKKQDEQMFFYILIGCAFASTIFFGAFYYYLDIYLLVYQCTIALSCFVIILLLFWVKVPAILLFRAIILVIFGTFYHHVMKTGGIYSPSLTVFTALPIIGFFYRPKTDRFVLMGLAVLCMISIWPLTQLGLTQNMIPASERALNTLVVSLFLLTVIMLFAVIFLYAIRIKNRRIRRSMEKLENATDKLIQSEKMASLGILSAGVAHEINNPLNFIKGGISEVHYQLEQLGHPEEVKESIEMVKEGVKRVSTIVKSLNHFSRTDQEELTRSDIHELLDNCLVMIKHELKEDVEIIKEYRATGQYIHCNEGKIHQVFLNVLMNAVQSISGSGSITIRTSLLSPEMLQVSVIDTGGGIDSSYLSRVSDPFFTTKDPGKGTGLGLYISYNILKDHDATIAFNSEIGVGTEVLIDFPVSN